MSDDPANSAIALALSEESKATDYGSIKKFEDMPLEKKEQMDARKYSKVKIRDYIKKAIEKNEDENEAVQTLVDIMQGDGMTDEPVANKDRIRAAEILMAYAYGKPTQITEVTGEGGSTIPVQFLLPVNNR